MLCSTRVALAFLLGLSSAAFADDIQLQFNPAQYGLKDVKKVVVRGTFTSWMQSAWTLNRGNDNIWRLTLAQEQVDIPGNSGQPEYKFVVNDNLWIGAEQEPAGHRFTGNFVVLFPGDDPADIARRDEQATVVNDQYETPEQSANFRAMEGGRLANQRLFRSYHPFIASRSELASEAPRLLAAQNLMKEKGIAAVLNLSDHSADVSAAPEYYRTLWQKGQVLLHITSYEDSYFHPEDPAYAYTLQRAFAFVASHQGPYLIHCRLGTDRTGVLSAVFQAFMGVPWTTIAADFERSNELGIREYRHQHLLAYGFHRMLGQWPQDITDLAGAMQGFLIRQGMSEQTLRDAANNLSR